MTTLDAPGATPDASAEPATSGVDLARVALRAARAQARNGAGESTAARRTPPRTRTRTRGDGREPVGLGGALQALITERAWVTPVAAGGVLAEWSAIAPRLAQHVQAVAHDSATGRLDLRPSSPAWATQVRLQQSALLAKIAAVAGNGTVREIRVLPPGFRSPEPEAPPGTPETSPVREPTTSPSPGYERAKDAHRTTRQPREVPLPVTEALARQDAALAASREPEDQFADAVAELERLGQRQRRAENTHLLALRRARAERGAGGQPAERQLPASMHRRTA